MKIDLNEVKMLIGLNNADVLFHIYLKLKIKNFKILRIVLKIYKFGSRIFKISFFLQYVCM